MFTQIAKLLSFVRTLSNGAKVTDVEIDVGGGDNKTAQHFSAPGDDSFPLKTDYVLASDVPRNGNKVAHGYLDPINEPVALEGDKRVYGRNPLTGETVNEIWLKNKGDVAILNDNGVVYMFSTGSVWIINDNSMFTVNAGGSISGSNSNGSFELQAGGDFVVNGVTIDSSGVVTIPSSLQLAGKELAGHDHPITWTDPAGSGTSGPNN